MDERFKRKALEPIEVGDTFSMECNGNILEEGEGKEMVRSMDKQAIYYLYCFYSTQIGQCPVCVTDHRKSM